MCKSIRSRWAGRLLGAATLALVALSLPAAALAAGCPKGVTSKPFTAFNDQAHYSLVQGGSFEEGAPGWSLSNASVENENESFNVAGGSHSLAIAADGVAASPTFCVSSEYPSFRLFARRTGGYGFGALDVTVRWRDVYGMTHEALSGTIQGGSSWAPSPVLRLGSMLPLWMPGSTLSVSLVFEPTYGSSWAIDDVYIDPYSR
jgi:hypothetical protein